MVDGVSPPFSQFGTSMKSRAMRLSTVGSVQLAEDAVPVPLDELAAVTFVRPALSHIGKDRRQGHNLGLVREVKNAVYVKGVQKLGRLNEAALDPILVLLVRGERKVQQRRAIEP